MKLYFSEFKADYEKYHFPYQVYLMKERDDDLDEIYKLGFLPSRQKKNLYYLARSIRINLAGFSFSSENRRVKRKTDWLDISIFSTKERDYDFKIGKMARDFYKSKFGKGVMSAYKIKWLYTSGASSHIIEYRKKSKDQAIGYCLVNKTKKSLHYAYPFYDLEYVKKNMGIGMMLSAIELAQKDKIKYVYLGTCYTESSLYKTQFKGLEYFNGWCWDNNLAALKELVRGEIEDHRIKKIGNKDEIFDRYGMKY